MKNTTKQAVPFTSYQKFAVFILAITQFTVILDFMVVQMSLLYKYIPDTKE